MTFCCCACGFVARLMIVSLLIKSGLDIALIGKDTPKLIVNRSHLLLTELQQYVYVDQDIVMRFVMKNQDMITQIYGYLLVGLGVLTVLNIKFFVKPLIALVLTSLVFFYAEFHKPYMIQEDKIDQVFQLVTILGGLFLINGYSRVQPILEVTKIIPVEEKKKPQKKEAPQKKEQPKKEKPQQQQAQPSGKQGGKKQKK